MFLNKVEVWLQNATCIVVNVLAVQFNTCIMLVDVKFAGVDKVALRKFCTS